MENDLKRRARDALTGIVHRLGVVGTIGAVGFLGVAAFGLLRGFELHGSRIKGAVYLDSPEIYTRERLVNDRYEQDGWLREELKRTVDLSPQSTQTTKARDRTDVLVNASAPAGEKSQDSAQPGAEPTRKHPIDDFQDRASYREEVRAELIENQLDDRHDLEGNTLYRLKFDASVVTMADNQDYAVIEVRLPVAGATAISGPELYSSWLRQTLAEARAAFDKRFEDVWNALTPAPAPGASPAVAAPSALISDQVRHDLSGVRARIQSDQKCDLPDLVKDILCLLDGTKRDQKDLRLIVRSAFAEDFAWITTERYRGLVKMEADNGRLEVPVLDRDPGDQAENEAKQLLFNAKVAEFDRIIQGASYRIYTYAVSPKESADRTATQSLVTNERQLAFGLPGVGSAQPASGTALDRREREAFASLIERNPRVVGFADSLSWAASFGWVIGPRFGLPSREGRPAEFTQQTAHYALSAIVSAPAWWKRIPMQTLVYWLNPKSGTCTDESGRFELKPCPPREWKGFGDRVRASELELPTDARVVSDVVTRALGLSEPQEPAIAKTEMAIATVEAEQPAEIVIPGQNLWRSPLVTLGNQQAIRIKVLPNMNGIVAYFDKIQMPAEWTDSAPTTNARLTVWTSHRHPDFVTDRVRIARARPRQDVAKPPESTPH